MADFSHDDLMFASRLANIRTKPRRAPIADDALGELAAVGGGPDDQDPLLKVMLANLVAERQAKQEDILRRRRESEAFNRERSATKEDNATKWQRALQAQIAANNREDAVDQRRRGWTVADQEAARRERGDERTHLETREDTRDKTGRIRTLTDYVAQARANGDDVAPELLAELASLTGQPGPAPATGAGGGLNKVQRTALTNSALGKLQEKVASGAMTPADAQAAMASLKDPAAAAGVVFEPPRRSPEQTIGDVVEANVAPFADKWQDTDAGDLFGGEGDRPGLLHESRVGGMDSAIDAMLRAGKTPDQIADAAAAALANQKKIPVDTLDSESIWDDDAGGKTAIRQYRNRWAQRAAERLAAGGGGH